MMNYETVRIKSEQLKKLIFRHIMHVQTVKKDVNALWSL